MSSESDAGIVLRIHPGYSSTSSLEEEHGRLTRWLDDSVCRRKDQQLLRSVRLVRRGLVRSELRLRGSDDFSSDSELTIDGWDEPAAGSITREEMQLLRGKSPADDGRIPIPESSQRLWAQHKYSVMARDPALYKELGPRVSGADSDALFEEIVTTCTGLLYQFPDEGRLRNALQHMWGYVSEYDDRGIDPGTISLNELAERTRRLSVEHSVTYLLHSTALSDLNIWM